jgi:hypothetical protein
VRKHSPRAFRIFARARDYSLVLFPQITKGNTVFPFLWDTLRIEERDFPLKPREE